ncbi:MAG TPA: flagellum-specific ATP synthase FliI, partial [Spongiibacteraceae bacterium]|nr:flagellum-specific ATP synthase FliI [Spongiibacteraceae bacterium]
HLSAAQRVRQLWSRYQQSRDLIAVGAYAAGSDPETDAAIRHLPAIRSFLRQGLDDAVPHGSSVEQLEALAQRSRAEARS